MRLSAARRDWLQLRLMCSIMLMRLQELYKTCRTFCYFILAQSGKIFAQFLCEFILSDLFYCKWENRFTTNEILKARIDYQTSCRHAACDCTIVQSSFSYSQRGV